MIWRFQPIPKHTIWGGNKLSCLLPDSSGSERGRLGEVWVLSGIPGSLSVVAEGIDAGKDLNSLVRDYRERLLGKKNYRRFQHKFPLLIKFIDAADDLSVQVHPDDKMAESLGLPFGKAEMWYVVDADPGARVGSGFLHPISPEKLPELTESGEIMDHLRYSDVVKGDVYFIPAGRIHVLGKGCLVLEIQESSDVTFRLYDYNRRDVNGKKRELHTEHASRALNYGDVDGHPIRYSSKKEETTLVDCSHFTTNLLDFSKIQTRDYSYLDSFVILTCIDGEATVCQDDECCRLSHGHCLLISADTDHIEIKPDTRFLATETYIP